MGLNIRQVINQNFENLKEYLKTLNSVAVSFSSGVDSTFLLKTAKDVLGENNVIAVTAKSCIYPERDFNAAIDFCQKENIKHFIIETDELNISDFCSNPENRCYLYKKDLFEKIKKIAKDNGMENVIEGSNSDVETPDLNFSNNAAQELGIKSPLQESKLSKDEVRIISNVLNLETWNKPSLGCLVSRFDYGEEITKEKLKMVENAEQALLDIGFRQFRVYIHSSLARIVLARDEVAKFLSQREKVLEKFTAIGFKHTALDLQGYKTKNLSEELTDI
ncbi:ATP-dependent sacrificial sulfur transferase LarE [bacterium]|nr:ATP-dependent sacrificial sulfur transferase LarE [bacterium]